jgi:peptidoglycan-N-acetylglucosamine deacetylase
MNTASTITWPGGCRAAVSLSYDDGLPVHYEHVAPLFESHGLRCTFYVPVVTGLRQYPHQFRRVAKAGHELGNHSLFHPCRCEGDRVNWLNPAYDLATYNERRWNEEMAVANFALQLVDGHDQRTFGNTCYDNWIGPDHDRVSLEPFMERHFLAARGELTGQPVNFSRLNFWNLGTINADFHTFADLRAEIEALIASGGWIIYTMHGVGSDTHRLHIDPDEHRRLVAWLAGNTARLWTAPVIDVVKYLRA